MACLAVAGDQAREDGLEVQFGGPIGVVAQHFHAIAQARVAEQRRYPLERTFHARPGGRGAKSDHVRAPVVAVRPGEAIDSGAGFGREPLDEFDHLIVAESAQLAVQGGQSGYAFLRSGHGRSRYLRRQGVQVVVQVVDQRGDAVCHFLTATPDQINSTTPNGHAPDKKP